VGYFAVGQARIWCGSVAESRGGETITSRDGSDEAIRPRGRAWTSSAAVVYTAWVPLPETRRGRRAGAAEYAGSRWRKKTRAMRCVSHGGSGDARPAGREMTFEDVPVGLIPMNGPRAARRHRRDVFRAVNGTSTTRHPPESGVTGRVMTVRSKTDQQQC